MSVAWSNPTSGSPGAALHYMSLLLLLGKLQLSLGILYIQGDNQNSCKVLEKGVKAKSWGGGLIEEPTNLVEYQN